MNLTQISTNLEKDQVSILDYDIEEIRDHLLIYSMNKQTEPHLVFNDFIKLKQEQGFIFPAGDALESFRVKIIELCKF